MQTTNQSIVENQVEQLAENNYFEVPINYFQLQHSITSVPELNSTYKKSLLTTQNSVNISCSHSSDIDFVLEKLKK